MSDEKAYFREGKQVTWDELADWKPAEGRNEHTPRPRAPSPVTDAQGRIVNPTWLKYDPERHKHLSRSERVMLAQDRMRHPGDYSHNKLYAQTWDPGRPGAMSPAIGRYQDIQRFIESRKDPRERHGLGPNLRNVRALAAQRRQRGMGDFDGDGIPDHLQYTAHRPQRLGYQGGGYVGSRSRPTKRWLEPPRYIDMNRYEDPGLERARRFHQRRRLEQQYASGRPYVGTSGEMQAQRAEMFNTNPLASQWTSNPPATREGRREIDRLLAAEARKWNRPSRKSRKTAPADTQTSQEGPFRLQFESGGYVDPQGYAGGGVAESTDTVPAMLTPGEFVVSRPAVRQIGLNNLLAMNAAGGGTNRPTVGPGGLHAQGGGIAQKPLQAGGGGNPYSPPAGANTQAKKRNS